MRALQAKAGLAQAGRAVDGRLAGEVLPPLESQAARRAADGGARGAELRDILREETAPFRTETPWARFALHKGGPATLRRQNGCAKRYLIL